METDISGAGGYYVDTVGKNKKAIEEYIRNQLHEDIANATAYVERVHRPVHGEQE